MKKALAIASCVLLVIALLATVYITYRFNVGSWNHDGRMSRFYPGVDFLLRTNEAKCLMSGVDPYKVWHQDVTLAPYFPYNQPSLCRKGFEEPLNAYCPWEYALAIPLSLVPRKVMWPIYFVSMFACLAFLLAIAFRRGWSIRRDAISGVLVATASFLCVIYPVYTNICVSNYALHLMLALSLMLIALNRGHDVLAGFCWALAMVKPNLAVLLAVPLLIRGKFLTCFVAAVTCLVLAVPASILCHTSLVELIMETPKASADIFFGCGTFPYCFCGFLPNGIDILLGVLVGLVVCCGLTWWMRKEDDWFLLALPAVVCSMCWSYTATHAHTLGWFLFLAIFAELLRRPKSRGLWVIAVLAVVVVSRMYRCLYGVATIYGVRVLDFLRHQEDTYRTVDSLNSTCVLLVCIAFCLWKKRKDVCT